MNLTRLTPLVRDPVLRRQLELYSLARLPSGMIILSLLLLASARLPTFTRVGGVVAAYTITVAVAAPLAGRLADRIGARRVLPLTAAVQLIGATVLLVSHSPASLIAGAVVTGAGLPPTAACLRARWRDLPTGLRTTVFAVDGIVLEAAQVVGPLLVSLLTAAFSPAAALGAGVGCSAVAAVATSATLAPLTPAGPSVRRWLGPLRLPVVDVLLAVLILVCSAIAVVEVSVVVFASAHHRPAVAGLLFAAMAGGSTVGGVLFAARESRRGARDVLALLCAATAAGFALLLTVGDHTWLLFVVLAVSNVAVSPIFAALFDFVSDVAPDGEIAETFTWLSSGNFVAISAGTALGGVLLTHGDLRLAYLVSVALLLAATGIAVLARSLSPAPHKI